MAPQAHRTLPSAIIISLCVWCFSYLAYISLIKGRNIRFLQINHRNFAPVWKMGRICEPPRRRNKKEFEFGFKGGNPCAEDTDIIFLVKSSIFRDELKDAIRSTWAVDRIFDLNGTKLSIEVRFLVGSHQSRLLSQVDLRNSIQGDFEDTFESVILKVAMGLRWYAKYCPHVPLIFLCDDDSEILPWNVAQWFKSLNLPLISSEPLYGGTVAVGGAIPVRGKHRYAITPQIFPCSKYPDYISGSLIIANNAMVQAWLELNWPYEATFYFDDIYLAYLSLRAKTKIGFFETNMANLLTCGRNMTTGNSEALKQMVFCHNSDDPTLSLALFQQICNATENYLNSSSIYWQIARNSCSLNVS